MASATIRTRFDSGGQVRLEPTSRGVDEALARLGAIMAQAHFDGTWQLMKICTANNCGMVFFDDSKKHSRKWCSTKCGSRSTSLSYRRRHLEEVRKSERNNAYRRRHFL